MSDNKWIPFGYNHLYGASLGNVLSLDSLAFEIKNFEVNGDGFYVVSQAGSTSGTREFGWWDIGGSWHVWLGGVDTEIGDNTEIFGTTAISVDRLGLYIDFVNSQYEIYDGTRYGENPSRNVLSSGAVTIGTSRVEGVPLRFGARGSSDTDTPGGAFFIDNAKFGDIDVYVDGAHVRDYDMVSSGTNVPDLIGGNNLTLHSPQGDLDSDGQEDDWEIPFQGLVAPEVLPIYAIDSNTLQTFQTITGQHAVGATSVEYRIMQAGVEVVTWTAVDSFADQEYRFTPQLSPGVGYTFEVREDGTEVDISEEFKVGFGIAMTGSSSGQLMIEEGIGTLSGDFSIKAASSGLFASYEAGDTISGQAIVEAANLIHGATDWPVVCYGYAAGGSAITDTWNPAGGFHYNRFINNSDDGNFTVLVDMCGYNDAFQNTIVTQADVAAVWQGFRSDLGRDFPIISGLSQRHSNPAVLPLWRAQQDEIDARANNYAFYRLDLEISTDLIHLTDADSVVAAQRFATIALSTVNQSAYYRGPSIASMQLTGAREITLTLDNNGTSYTSINPITDVGAFYIDEGGEVGIVSAEVVGGNIVLTADEDLTDPAVSFAGYLANYADAPTAAGYPTVNSPVPFPIQPLFSPMRVGSVPTITGVSGTNANGTMTVTLSGGYTSPVSSVIVNGVAQTNITEVDANTVTVSLGNGGARFGTETSVIIEDAVGRSQPYIITYEAPVGFEHITFVTPNDHFDSEGVVVDDEYAWRNPVSFSGNTYTVIADSSGNLSSSDAVEGLEVEFLTQQFSGSPRFAMSNIAMQSLGENEAPEIVSGGIPPLSYTVGESVNFDASQYVTDTDTRDEVTYSMSPANIAGLSINSSTGLVTGTATETSQTSLTFTYTDLFGQISSAQTTIEVGQVVTPTPTPSPTPTPTTPTPTPAPTPATYTISGSIYSDPEKSTPYTDADVSWWAINAQLNVVVANGVDSPDQSGAISLTSTEFDSGSFIVVYKTSDGLQLGVEEITA